MRDSGKDRIWLDSALRRELKRVPAPAKLWDLVTLPRNARQPEPAAPLRPLVWMFAGASVLAASIVAVAWGSHANPAIRMQSNQVSEVRAWIHQRTGLEVPLASPASPSIQMESASISDSGSVEVQFRAGGREALLVVSTTQASRQGYLHAKLRNDSPAFGQTYSLAVQSGGDLRATCLVCHAESAI